VQKNVLLSLSAPVHSIPAVPDPLYSLYTPTVFGAAVHAGSSLFLPVLQGSILILLALKVEISHTFAQTDLYGSCKHLFLHAHLRAC
jgi:hypothetical protein